MPDQLSHTDVGRELLAQDYLLKQITASLLYPEKDLGRKFWDKVYSQAYDKFGTTDIPVDTFNKVWIAPDEATVYQHGNNAFVSGSHLKVMLESDYEAASHQKDAAESSAPAGDKAAQDALLTRGHSAPLQDNQRGSVSPGTLPAELALDTKATQGADRFPNANTQELAKDVVREIILPVLEKEVNEGKNFAALRQVFQSLILAGWYKNALKTSLLNQVYANTNKVEGITIPEKDAKEKVYAQYMNAYQKGVYNYIKDEFDRNTQETLPRKYFSGGILADFAMTPKVNTNVADGARIKGAAQVISYRMQNVDAAAVSVGQMDPNRPEIYETFEYMDGPSQRLVKFLQVIGRDVKSDNVHEGQDVRKISLSGDQNYRLEIDVVGNRERKSKIQLFDYDNSIFDMSVEGDVRDYQWKTLQALMRHESSGTFSDNAQMNPYVAWKLAQDVLKMDAKDFPEDTSRVVSSNLRRISFPGTSYEVMVVFSKKAQMSAVYFLGKGEGFYSTRLSGDLLKTPLKDFIQAVTDKVEAHPREDVLWDVYEVLSQGWKTDGPWPWGGRVIRLQSVGNEIIITYDEKSGKSVLKIGQAGFEPLFEMTVDGKDLTKQGNIFTEGIFEIIYKELKQRRDRAQAVNREKIADSLIWGNPQAKFNDIKKEVTYTFPNRYTLLARQDKTDVFVQLTISSGVTVGIMIYDANYKDLNLGEVISRLKDHSQMNAGFDQAQLIDQGLLKARQLVGDVKKIAGLDNTAGVLELALAWRRATKLSDRDVLQKAEEYLMHLRHIDSRTGLVERKLQERTILLDTGVAASIEDARDVLGFLGSDIQVAIGLAMIAAVDVMIKGGSYQDALKVRKNDGLDAYSLSGYRINSVILRGVAVLLNSGVESSKSQVYLQIATKSLDQYLWPRLLESGLSGSQVSARLQTMMPYLLEAVARLMQSGIDLDRSIGLVKSMLTEILPEGASDAHLKVLAAVSFIVEDGQRLHARASLALKPMVLSGILGAGMIVKGVVTHNSIMTIGGAAVALADIWAWYATYGKRMDLSKEINARVLTVQGAVDKAQDTLDEVSDFITRMVNNAKDVVGERGKDGLYLIGNPAPRLFASYNELLDETQIVVQLGPLSTFKINVDGDMSFERRALFNEVAKEIKRRRGLTKGADGNVIPTVLHDVNLLVSFVHAGDEKNTRKAIFAALGLSDEPAVVRLTESDISNDPRWNYEERLLLNNKNYGDNPRLNGAVVLHENIAGLNIKNALWVMSDFESELAPLVRKVLLGAGVADGALDGLEDGLMPDLLEASARLKVSGFTSDKAVGLVVLLLKDFLAYSDDMDLLGLRVIAAAHYLGQKNKEVSFKESDAYFTMAAMGGGFSASVLGLTFLDISWEVKGVLAVVAVGLVAAGGIFNMYRVKKRKDIFQDEITFKLHQGASLAVDQAQGGVISSVVSDVNALVAQARKNMPDQVDALVELTLALMRQPGSNQGEALREAMDIILSKQQGARQLQAKIAQIDGWQDGTFTMSSGDDVLGLKARTLLMHHGWTESAARLAVSEFSKVLYPFVEQVLENQDARSADLQAKMYAWMPYLLEAGARLLVGSGINIQMAADLVKGLVGSFWADEADDFVGVKVLAAAQFIGAEYRRLQSGTNYLSAFSVANMSRSPGYRGTLNPVRVLLAAPIFNRLVEVFNNRAALESLRREIFSLGADEISVDAKADPAQAIPAELLSGERDIVFIDGSRSMPIQRVDSVEFRDHLVKIGRMNKYHYLNDYTLYVRKLWRTRNFIYAELTLNGKVLGEIYYANANVDKDPDVIIADMIKEQKKLHDAVKKTSVAYKFTAPEGVGAAMARWGVSVDALEHAFDGLIEIFRSGLSEYPGVNGQLLTMAYAPDGVRVILSVSQGELGRIDYPWEEYKKRMGALGSFMSDFIIEFKKLDNAAINDEKKVQGGIDLGAGNYLKIIATDAAGMPEFDPVQIQQIQKDLRGLVPVPVGVPQPVNLRPLLGLAPLDEGIKVGYNPSWLHGYFARRSDVLEEVAVI
ncbi:MAG: hypothetical protein V2A70_10715 [Candidatus Omnitrophota bacterium]